MIGQRKDTKRSKFFRFIVHVVCKFLQRLLKNKVSYANLQKVKLRGANLQDAYLEEIRNYTYKQLKLACNWDKAIYKGRYDQEERVWVPIEPDNTNIIEELKKDITLGIEEPVNCSRWQEK